MKISKIKVPGVQTPIDIKDTTYQFQQDGNVLKMGVDEGTKSAIYTPDLSSLASAADLESQDEATAAALNELDIKSYILQNDIPSAKAIATALNLLNKKIIFLQNGLDQLKSQMNN